MSEMVERVRAAILHAERFGKDRASAAIAALREPTEAMCQAAFDDGWVATTTGLDDFARWWRAMIDAALK